MLHLLDWHLNMLTLLRYCSLALQPLLVLPSLGPIWSLFGYGWYLECWKLLRLIVVTIFHGASQTSYLCMAGKFSVSHIACMWYVFIVNLLFLKYYLNCSAALISMTIITVCYTPSQAITLLLLLTWTGKFFGFTASISGTVLFHGSNVNCWMLVYFPIITRASWKMAWWVLSVIWTEPIFY